MGEHFSPQLIVPLAFTMQPSAMSTQVASSLIAVQAGAGGGGGGSLASKSQDRKPPISGGQPFGESQSNQSLSWLATQSS